MLPGLTLIIACPICKAEHLLPTLASGNTLGARYWTDGYCEAPMLPEQPPVTRCGRCRGFFWCADAEEHGKLDCWAPGEPPDGREYYDVRWLTVAQYDGALEAGIARTAGRERALRTLAWWKANARLRTRAKAVWAPSLVSRIRGNLERLQKLLDAHEPRGWLWAAEIARELGRFEEAGKRLRSCAARDSGIAVTAALIEELVAKGDARVREVPA